MNSSYSCLICENADKEVCKFRFPKEPNIRQKWAQFCHANGVSVYNNNSRICQLHFTTDNIKSHGRNTHLKCDAVPSINVEKCSPAPLQTKNSRSCLICGKCNSLEKVSTFKFPKDAACCSHWIDFCKMQGHTVYKNSRLCSKHFVLEDFLNDPNRQPRLKLTAIPSLVCKNVPESICNDSPSSNDSPSISTHCCLICGRNKQEKLSYFSFPKNPTYREEWLKFCQSIKLNLIPNKNSRLCSKHFTNEDFQSRCRLTPSAIPTLHDEQSISHQNEELPSGTSSFSCDGALSATPTRTNDELLIGTGLPPSEAVPYSRPIRTNDELPSVPSDTSLSPSEGDLSARPIRTNNELPSDTNSSPCDGDPSVTPKRTGTKRKSLRYLNDFDESDIVTPRRATKFLRLAKTTTHNLRMRNKALLRRLRNSNKKISNLKQLVNHIIDQDSNF